MAAKTALRPAQTRVCASGAQPQNYAPSLRHTQAPSSRSLTVGSPIPPRSSLMRPSKHFSRLALLFAASPSHCVPSRPRPPAPCDGPSPGARLRAPSDAVVALPPPCESPALLFVPLRSAYCMSGALRTTIAHDLLAPCLTFHYLHSLI
ncbi:uncharacterized protein TrAtP1_008970 [Trichoderma atroviride]|uniref:uncharacterized protein n=1 Tax=Hypocrea atroviridis TaxID=63577 RepID=UPI003325318D|nr:hypothetical protein TrAtP1_008970 [Trichoderma atroviride]